MSENSPKLSGESLVVESHPRSREQLIEQAISDYQSPLIGYAVTLLNNIDMARDVVQDTFLRLCRQDLTQVQDHLKPWLFTVCRNRALDVLRKEQRVEELEPHHWQRVAGPGLQPDERMDIQERLAQMRSFLNRLTPNQREVIVLKFQQGLSYQEIHQVTNLSTSNIGFLIHSGLTRLRESLPDDILS